MIQSRLSVTNTRSELCAMALLIVLVLVAGACSSEPAAPATEPVTGVAPPAAEAANPTPPPAPKPDVAAVPSDVPDTIDGANTQLGEVTVDGFTAEGLECKADGGLFAAMAIVGKLAEHKAALAKCADSSESVKVHFTNEGGKVDDIRVAGASTPAVARCVADAMAATALPGKRTCIVSFKVGPAAE